MPSEEKPEPYWPPEPLKPTATSPGSRTELEELLTHTRIPFPTPLSVGKVAQMFEYVAQQLTYDITYTVASACQTLLLNFERPTSTTLRNTIEGTVVGRGYRTPFACESNHLDPTLISALAFQVPFSLALKDIPATQRELMDQVRVVIKEYLGV